MSADARYARLVEVLAGRRIAVLTGAGCSTESGIPDYRGPGTRARARQPIQGRDFARDAEVRRRYWARSVVGWPRIADARPNAAHRALAAMEEAGVVQGLITQNVDRLHHAAGSRAVIELHGTVAEVRCVGCGAREPRGEVQARLLELNPGWMAEGPAVADGDAELDDARVASFRVAGCRACGGVIRPDVVFFGENVPAERVANAYGWVERAEALLVVGTSLAVYSGLRFVRAAARAEIPIAMVNLGESRGTALATVSIEARAGDALPALLDALVDGGQGV